MSRTIYRVQDSTGRGPFRPGLPALWADDDADEINTLKPIFEEFGESLVKQMRIRMDLYGGAIGCGCATIRGLARWFNRVEQLRLQAMGFSVVAMKAQHVFAESDNQIVFWRKKPLRKHCVVLPWQALLLPMVDVASGATPEEAKALARGEVGE